MANIGEERKARSVGGQSRFRLQETAENVICNKNLPWIWEQMVSDGEEEARALPPFKTLFIGSQPRHVYPGIHF